MIPTPTPPSLTPWKIGRGVLSLVGSLLLIGGGVVALVRGDGIASVLLTFGGILLALTGIYVGLLLRMRRMDRENRFGIPFRPRD